MTPPFTLKAPAKINWFLHVKGRREDGYHEIQSLMQRVSLYDSMTFEQWDAIEVLTDTDIPPLENLVYKAAVMLNEATGAQNGARITLRKTIPLAAGLAGGSTDAAFTLKGLDMLWGLGLPMAELQAMAAALGSDVPFFLGGPAALVEGRGERVIPVRLTRPFTLLLAKPALRVSTRWAYSEVRELTKKRNNIKLFLRALEEADIRSLTPLVRNDLEGPVSRRHPMVGELKNRMLEEGALLSSMSGSGPTVFGVFENSEQAARAAGAISADWSAVVETLTGEDPA
jgi:4-diphosphocytidyl-2-C-methyl-D-erythritol kinase